MSRKRESFDNVNLSKRVFAMRVNELRQQDRTTIKTLAAYVGVNEKTVRRWLDPLADTMPDLHNIFDLANFFGVSIDYLVGRNDVKDIELTRGMKQYFARLYIAFCEKDGSRATLEKLKRLSVSLDPIIRNENLPDWYETFKNNLVSDFAASMPEDNYTDI